MIQLDGLPGVTYVHGGLAPGNRASERHAGMVSQPRLAARQCLAKMRLVHALGVTQAFLPPLPRPHLEFLARCGFAGADAPAQALRVAPRLLAMAASSASIWTANAATCAPAGDGGWPWARILPANLAALPHRWLECEGRTQQLRQALDPTRARLVAPLPAHPALGDEGAANHTRLVGPRGVCHLFVHGQDDDGQRSRTPARQTLAASLAAARVLGVEALAVHARQSVAAIDAGAFHNDVVMVGEGDRILVHAQAWDNQAAVLEAIQALTGRLRVVEIPASSLDLDEAVRCYLFNGQLLATPQGWVLVAPQPCAEGPAARVISDLLNDGFIQRVLLVEVGGSMRGGGGPACLRLRLPVADDALAEGLRLDGDRLAWLDDWVGRWYPAELTLQHLADPGLATRSAEALAELAAWTGIPVA